LNPKTALICRYWRKKENAAPIGHGIGIAARMKIKEKIAEKLKI